MLLEPVPAGAAFYFKVILVLPLCALNFKCLQPNAEPLVLERVPTDTEARQGGPAAWIHTKASRLAWKQMLLLLPCFVACAWNAATPPSGSTPR